MFTGLIRYLGTLESRSPRPGGARLRIAAPPDLLARAERGASVAVNGACLTSVAADGRAWEAELSEETLAKTTLGRLALGARVHLEPALCVGDPLDGHLVSGHVDGLGQLRSRPEGQAGAAEGIWRFSMPTELAAMMAHNGSVAVDGISLTVVDCGSDWFSVALILETVACTALKGLRPGDPVNLEADPVGRFVARALALRGTEERLTRFAQGGWNG